MKSNLLSTKFHQPAVPPRHVPRPQLVQRLNEGLEEGRVLTLVSAPAGFGKTICASEWLGGLDLPVAWLSLDAADNDPARFFTYLVAALQRVDARLGKDVEGALNAGDLPPLEAITTTLLNDILDARRRFVLALDDFHLVHDNAILDAVGRLIAGLPACMHLALITREDPPLPLSRLRANNQMTEVRAADLRFNGGEAGRFLNEMMGLALSAENLALLEERTEGWIAGLQLAGLSMRGRDDPAKFVASLSGSHRFILTYLTEEVLSRQSPEVQEFLLQTSLLGALNGDLCDAVTGRCDSAGMLERLFSANLFLVPLDDEQRWYRYHHLFADLLKSQQRRLPQEETARLLQCASHWYENAGMPAEAIESCLAAADYACAMRLLEAHVMSFLLKGYAKSVENWMSAIPAELRAHSPRVNLALAWACLLRGNYAGVSDRLAQAEAAVEQLEPASPEARDLQAEALSLRANLCNVQGKPAEGAELARRALQGIQPGNAYLLSLACMGLGGACRLTGDYPGLVDAYQKTIQHSRAAGNLMSEVLAAAALVLTAIPAGQLHTGYETGVHVLERCQRSGALPPVAGGLYGSVGIIHYEWNHLEKARAHFARAWQLSTLSGHNAGLVFSRTLMARLLQAEGRLDEASRALEEAAEMLPLGTPAWVGPEVAAQRVRLLLAQDRPDEAEEVLRRHNIAPGGAPQPAPSGELLALARLRIELHRQPPSASLQDAVERAGRLADSARQALRLGAALSALLLRARLLALAGRMPEALQDLETALQMGEPQGYLRTFVDEGPALAALLRRVPGANYVRRLLAAFPESSSPTPPAPQTDLVEPLTEREVEVLRLIAEGLKYEEIAARLVITLNTVRFYVKEIYSKLNVNNRTRAVESARQMGLL